MTDQIASILKSWGEPAYRLIGKIVYRVTLGAICSGCNPSVNAQLHHISQQVTNQ